MPTRRDFFAGSAALLGVAVTGRAVASRAIRFKNSPFTLGVASGYPSPSSVMLWTRLAPSPLEPGGGMPTAVVPVEWRIARDEKMSAVVRRGTVHASAEWAHSVHVQVTGLEPAREYWYQFRAGREISVVGRTRTAPAADSPVDRLRLAVVSCQHYEHGYFSAYQHIVRDEPDLVVHVGDYIYESSQLQPAVRSHGAPEAFSLDDYRARYALYKLDTDLATAHRLHPWLVMWDDHEVENDYADSTSGMGTDPQMFLARRIAASRAYYEHMPLPPGAAPSGVVSQLYASRAFGNLASINMLDQRQYRSPRACLKPGAKGGARLLLDECPELLAADRTMLGGQQEAWLSSKLATSRARWNLLAQGTVMTHVDELEGPGRRYWTDAWNGYPAARARLINTLTEHHVANAVVLSGDIHAFMVSDLHQHADELDSPVVASEFVTTSVSSNAMPQEILSSLLPENPNIHLATTAHRGYLRLDLTPQRLQGDLIALDTVQKPSSTSKVLASYVVAADRPGPVRV